MFLPYYKKWLIIREQIMKETNQEHDYIFINRDGLPANADRLRDWMSNWTDVVGQPCYPHNFRHYHISFLKSLDIEVMARAPYDKLYVDYILAQIDYYNKDFEGYNNNSYLFNELLDEYIRKNTQSSPGAKHKQIKNL
jgi:hypothetical protein